MKKFYFCFLYIYLLACSSKNNLNNVKEAEQQIVSAEASFEKAVKDLGVKEAFLEFADDSVAISRFGKIYIAKKGIEEYFNSQLMKNTSLTWKPDFVKASISGDMGYTYGKYKFSGMDSTGKEIYFEGIFHTVWKRQKDGSWKFVYD